MALFNIFKKEDRKNEKKPIEVEERNKEVVKEEKREPVKAKEGKKTGIASRVLLSAHVTEKATDLTGMNKYVFNVTLVANKIEIKKAVEELYNVKVIGVNITHVPGKKRRLGRSEGFREGLEKGSKKAIVELKKGDKIEILPR